MDNNDKLDGAVSPAFHTTPTSPSWKPSHHAPNSGAPNSGSSLDTSANEDDIDVIFPPSTLSTQSPAHFVLSNFFFAMSLISLILFIIFSTVTWFTVLRDARSMSDQLLSNATGVSLRLYHMRMVLTTVATVGIDTRPQRSTVSGCMRVIHLMESPRLRRGYHI